MSAIWFPFPLCDPSHLKFSKIDGDMRVWRTHGSSLANDSVLNEAGVCELLKGLSSFPAPPPHLFSPALGLLFLTCTDVLPSFLICSYSPLLDKLIWLMPVNPVLSLGTDLAHIPACSYHISNLRCTETVVIYCYVLYPNSHMLLFFPSQGKKTFKTNTAGVRQEYTWCISQNSKRK